jgi:undecaprenyl diphosphate synthase
VATSPVKDSPTPSLELSPDQLPRHVAIIMDGNGRWAQRNKLPRIEGHRRGTKTVARVVAECQKLGVRQVTLYCLSHENWKRPSEELEFLMHLMQQFMIESRAEMIKREIRLRVIGRRDKLPPEVQQEMDKSIEMTRRFTDFCLCLAINYGARQEIVDAVQALACQVAAGNMDPSEIDEHAISAHLYTADMSDPDLLIRTAGEMRISNYLLWQISYAELWVTDRCWPEFRIEDLHQAFRDYSSRVRRYGGLV